MNENQSYEKENSVQEFISYCQKVGSDEGLVQGPGGNISVKTSGQEMIIKASGSCLKEVNQTKGQVSVNYPALVNFYQTYNSDNPFECEEKAIKDHLNVCLKESSNRPSIETGFHALLGKVVIHTHPNVVNLLTCSQEGESIINDLFVQNNFCWVPYKSPGFFLTKEINKKIKENNLNLSDPVVLFLQNHGLIVSANSFDDAWEIQNSVLKNIKNYFQFRNILIEDYLPDRLVPYERGFISQNEKLKKFLVDYPAPKTNFLFPDIIVFGEEIFDNQKNDQYQIMNHNSLYYQLKKEKAESVNSILNSFLYLIDNIKKFGKLKVLTSDEVNYIKNMSGEKYRQKIDSTSQDKIKVIIPMTGLGTRFIKAGYQEPKPLIEVEGKPIIEHVVNMFPGENDFIFIVNSGHIKETKIIETLKRIKPEGQIIIEEEHKKIGPAYHTLLAKHLIPDDEPVIVSYCDFFVNWDYSNFKQKMKETNCDGCVISYVGFHPHLLGSDLYGSLLVDENNFMTHYKEKHTWTPNKMECHQSAGSYYFKKGKYLKQYLQEVLESEENFNGEYYISQPYPLMHRDGLKIYVYEVDHFCQWGTPKDFEEYLFWSKVFQEKAKEPKIYKYWKKFFNKMNWHPYREGKYGFDNQTSHK